MNGRIASSSIRSDRSVHCDCVGSYPSQNRRENFPSIDVTTTMAHRADIQHSAASQSCTRSRWSRETMTSPFDKYGFFNFNRRMKLCVVYSGRKSRHWKVVKISKKWCVVVVSGDGTQGRNSTDLIILALCTCTCLQAKIYQRVSFAVFHSLLITYFWNVPA